MALERVEQLDGKTVVVIGGSSGIGLATARAAKAEGAKIAIAGRSQDKLDSAAAQIGDGTRTVALDCTDEAAMQKLFAGLDRVDHILVTAGEPAHGAFLEYTTEQLHSHIDTRLWGAVFAAKYGAPKMTGGGSMTFVTAPNAAPSKDISPLAIASCGAVDALARSLALQLAPIRANTLQPGLIQTPLLDHSFAGSFGDKAEMMKGEIAKGIPAGHLGSADQTAHAVLFLMQNGYVTGQALLVDGGLVLA